METDRRIVEQKIHRLERELKDVRRHRAQYRKHRKRAGVPVVSLVGYTNAGKSTLLNALSHADVPVEDRLFATLDPVTRRVMLPAGRVILLTDTVGFIHKQPPAVVAAFRATLEELDEADVILHVVDMTHKNAAEQCQTVESILADLGLAEKRRVTVLNKIDLLAHSDLEPLQSGDPGTVLISAAKGWGLDRLLQLISEMLDRPDAEVGKAESDGA